MTIDPASAAPGSSEVPGSLVLFGHEPAPATARVLPRSRRWRTTGALRAFAVGLLLAPVVGLVPPHAPWALGALAVGIVFARRRFEERWTILGIEGRCPRCGEAVEVDGPTRLRSPHPVPCEACHHESSLRVDTLPGVGSDTDPPRATPPLP